MQEEAARRAQKLHAQIWIELNGPGAFEARDIRSRRQLEVVRGIDRAVLQTLPYRLDRFRIWATNTFRKLNFGYYLAGGSANNLPWFENLVDYLTFRHGWLARPVYQRVIALALALP